METVNRFLNL